MTIEERRLQQARRLARKVGFQFHKHRNENLYIFYTTDGGRISVAQHLLTLDEVEAALRDIERSLEPEEDFGQMQEVKNFEN